MMMITNAPVWVWPLFAALVALGVLQMRTMMVSKPRVFIVPLVLFGVSLVSVFSMFHGDGVALAAWACGAALALALNLLVLGSPVEARFHAATKKYEVPGSMVPLVLMMVIFSARFVVGAAKVMAPALVASIAFEVGVGAVLGFASGLFLARALVVLRSAVIVASPQ